MTELSVLRNSLKISLKDESSLLRSSRTSDMESTSIQTENRHSTDMKEKSTSEKVQTSRRKKKTLSPQLKRNVFTHLYINVSMFGIAAVALRSTMTGKMMMMVLVSFFFTEKDVEVFDHTARKRRQRRITIEKSVKFSLRW